MLQTSEKGTIWMKKGDTWWCDPPCYSIYIIICLHHNGLYICIYIYVWHICLSVFFWVEVPLQPPIIHLFAIEMPGLSASLLGTIRPPTARCCRHHPAPPRRTPVPRQRRRSRTARIPGAKKSGICQAWPKWMKMIQWSNGWRGMGWWSLIYFHITFNIFIYRKELK